ncbi:hypothetical protein SpCBS45565_g02992 [Spizellomyces sp. 'palustris']|nr:hypothetical protein SpCBS45565_g02992 [Spizellomyces sp. 'palustris']
MAITDEGKFHVLLNSMTPADASVYMRTAKHFSRILPSINEQPLTIDSLVKSSPGTAAERAALERCHIWRDQILEKSTRVRKLMQGLAEKGCAFRKKNFTCITCDEKLAGGFGPAVGVHLCSNIFHTKEHMEDTMAHELVHAYDYCRANLVETDCQHHACTEIRAASLSGDCDMSREWSRGNLGFFGQFEVLSLHLLIIVQRNRFRNDSSM